MVLGQGGKGGGVEGGAIVVKGRTKGNGKSAIDFLGKLLEQVGGGDAAIGAVGVEVALDVDAVVGDKGHAHLAGAGGGGTKGSWAAKVSGVAAGGAEPKAVDATIGVGKKVYGLEANPPSR